MENVLLIIPAYNEADNIQMVVEKIINEYPQFDYIVINDGSSDATGSICRRRKYFFLNLPINLGLAGAFQAGMKYAYMHGYSYAVQYDGDGQHNPEYIEKMLVELQNKNADIVIGSRFMHEKKKMTARMLGNSIIEKCILLTTGKRIQDSTSGMRMYNRKMIEILAHSMNYGPEPDTMAYLIRCGAKVIEIPVKMNERMAGESYISFMGAIRYMVYMCSSILMIQWFRRRDII